VRLMTYLLSEKCSLRLHPPILRPGFHHGPVDEILK
jgi:hypothetical protein